ncbi:hypothetical protein KCP70_13280 [Salmonella enterica subsp. enterica]|nr:hypothetical protein KCP70_13280 [Salmonella enterica subsp. enterica]
MRALPARRYISDTDRRVVRAESLYRRDNPRSNPVCRCRNPTRRTTKITGCRILANRRRFARRQRRGWVVLGAVYSSVDTAPLALRATSATCSFLTARP